MVGRTAEDQRAATHDQVRARPEAAGAAADARHGGELEVAGEDREVTGESVGAREADDAIRLTPAAEVIVDVHRTWAGNHTGKGHEAACPGARDGEADSAADGDVPAQRQRAKDAVAEVTAEGGACSERDRSGQRDRQRIGGGRGDVVDVEFGDRGRGQRQPVRGSPSLAVLPLPSDLAQVHLYRASAEGVGARRDDGATGDQHPARPAGIVAGEAEVAGDLVATAGSVDRR